jgi:hypothetical protein
LFTVGGNHVDATASASGFECLQPLTPRTPAIALVIAFVHT